MKTASGAGWRELLFGICSGVVISTPLLGRSILVPGQLFALIALVASACLWLVCEKNFRPERRILFACSLIAIYFALVAQSAVPEQWAFLANPMQWSGHSNDYIRSKLVVFLVTSLPPIATALMFSLLGNRRAAFRGIAGGIIAVSIIGMIVTIAASNGLYRSDYDTASDWYMGRNRAQFSIISMGILYILGGTASCLWLGSSRNTSRAIAVFVGLCLFGVSILIRRVDTILFVIAVTAIGSIYLRQSFVDLPSLAKTVAIIVAIPAISWPIVANEFSVSYWAHFVTGYSSRVEAASNAVSIFERGGRAWNGNAQMADGAETRPLSFDYDRSPSRVWGTGLGSYAANSKDGLLYPHNLMIETFLESGPIAALAFFALLVTLLLPVGTHLYRGSASRYEVISSAAAVTLFLAALKTGDITNVGPVTFFAIVASSLCYGSVSITPAAAGEIVARAK